MYLCFSYFVVFILSFAFSFQYFIKNTLVISRSISKHLGYISIVYIPLLFIWRLIKIFLVVGNPCRGLSTEGGGIAWLPINDVWIDYVAIMLVTQQVLFLHFYILSYLFLYFFLTTPFDT